ncbi:MAG: helix-turn-helix transcriptional regulator [Xanthomonadales bacterium]|jgi:transcriptional regulator with XRE-family HTH domain|nr:helix-turn-helix transcriptional regulator [Xanthomonadales bacterium]
MDVANRIKAWRQALGLTQEQFAALASMPKRTLVGYENDEREPGAAALALLARTGVNVNWLLTGEGEMRSTPALAEPAPAAYLAADHPQAERWRKLIELVDGIEDTERRSALLSEWFSRAQDASELMQIRRLLRDRKPAA